jgi:hypothetical protein
LRLARITSILPTLLMSKCSLRAAPGPNLLAQNPFTLFVLAAVVAVDRDALVYQVLPQVVGALGAVLEELSLP